MKSRPTTSALRLRAQPMLLIILLAALLAGCGYNQSGGDSNRIESGYTWNSLYREDIQTVAVPVFVTKDFRRGVELRLTEAVIKQLEASAPYKVVPRERADTILEGQVTSIAVGTVNRDFRTNLPKVQSMTLTVDFIWKDLRSGRILMQRQNFQQEANFFPSLGESEFVGAQEAVEKLALGIVQELQADW